MKKIFYILIFFVLIGACKDDDPQAGPAAGEFYLNLSDSVVLVNDTLTYIKVGVETNGEFWDIVEDSTAVWCEPSMNDTHDNRSVTLKVGQNPDAKMREAVITIIGEEDIQKTITVKQMGTAPTILYFADDLDKLSDDSLTIRIDIRANLEYDVIIPESCRGWIYWIGTDEVDPVRNFFSVDRNVGEARPGEIWLQAKSESGVKEIIHLRQLSYDAEYKPEDASGIGVNKDVPLKIKSGTASSFQSGEGIEKSFDGDLSTIYHAKWSGGDLPITLIYTLQDGAEVLDYLVYYPRQSGSNGHIGTFELYYSKTAEGDDWIKVGDYDFQKTGTTKRLEMSEPLKEPKRVKFFVKEGQGGFASCAEMQFWQNAPEDNRLLTIFTDETYSELNPGVTYTMIASNLQEDYPFRFNIAKHLLNGDYPLENRVHHCKVYRDPVKVATELKTSRYSRYDNPTGIYVSPSEDLVVFVGPTNGANIGLYVANTMNGGIEHTEYLLKEGENLIEVTKDGLVYIGYYSESSSLSDLKVHIASGSVNGLFDIRKHTNSDWHTLLSNTSFTAMDVVGEKIHMIFPVANWNAINNPEELLGVWDDIVRLEHRLMGLEKYPIYMPKNRILAHADMDPDASYMYATDYRTAYSPSTLSEMVNANAVRTTAVWGPAHEIGHVNQVRPGMKWAGTTEVTNNLYSMYVQTQFGNTSRLQSDNTYNKAFNEIIVEEQPHVGRDVFYKLVPFWQLQLYAEVTGVAHNFYPDVFEKARNSTESNDGKCQLNFVCWCSELLNLNLTDFFMAWGFLRPVDMLIDDYGSKQFTVKQEDIDATIATISTQPAMPGGMIYLTDANKDYMRDKITVNISSADRNGNKFTITGNGIMAFKVYDVVNKLIYIASVSPFTVPSELTVGKVTAVQWDGTEIVVTF